MVPSLRYGASFHKQSLLSFPPTCNMFPTYLAFQFFLLRFKMYLRETGIAEVYRRRISGLLAYYLNCDNLISCVKTDHILHL